MDHATIGVEGFNQDRPPLEGHRWPRQPDVGSTAGQVPTQWRCRTPADAGAARKFACHNAFRLDKARERWSAPQAEVLMGRRLPVGWQPWWSRPERLAICRGTQRARLGSRVC